MQILGIGKKSDSSETQSAVKTSGSLVANLNNQLKRILKLTAHYETTIIAIAVAAVLAATSLRMLHYVDPPIDDSRVQDIVAKNKKVRIDPKTVQKLQQLQDSGSTPTVKVENGRINPFTE
jgi:hypothetical protein